MQYNEYIVSEGWTDSSGQCGSDATLFNTLDECYDYIDHAISELYKLYSSSDECPELDKNETSWELEFNALSYEIHIITLSRESLDSQLQMLRQKALETIYSKVTNPNMNYHVDVPYTPWLAPNPPCITTVRIFPDENTPMEGITSEGKHYVNGTVKVLWDDEEDYDDVEDLGTDTLIDLAEAIENI